MINKKAIGFILFSLLICFYSSAQNNNELDSIINVLIRSKNDTLKISKLLETSWAFKYEQSDNALLLSKQAESLSKKLHYDKLNAKIYLTIGVCLYYTQEHVKSFEYLFKALTIAEKDKDSLLVVDCLLNIGNNHLKHKNFNLANKFFLRAIKYADRKNDNYIDALNNLAIIAGETGNHKDAEKYYLKAIDVCKEDHDNYMLSILLNNLGDLYTTQKKYTNAYNCYIEALKVAAPFNEIEITANIYSGLAILYDNLGNYEEALKNYKYALNIIKTKNDIKLISTIYEKMSQLYTKQNNYEESYKYHKLFKQVTDSLFTQEKSKQIAELNIKYDTEKKEGQINSLKTEYNLKEAIAKRQTWIIRICIIAVFIFIILSYSLVNNIRKRNTAYHILEDKNNLILKQNEKIERQKKELESYTTELEQENILAQFETLKNQVNPHFLFNSLGVLSSLIKKDPDQAYLFTKEFAKIYRVVLELKGHALVYLSEELDFTESYLFLQQIRFSRGLVVNTNIPDDYLYYSVPPFSLQLLLENAIKHNIISEQQPLDISIYIEDDFLVVKNTIQLRTDKNLSTGVGNRNLLDRYKLLSDRTPLFYADGEYYYAKMPLLNEDI